MTQKQNEIVHRNGAGKICLPNPEVLPPPTRVSTTTLTAVPTLAGTVTLNTTAGHYWGVSSALSSNWSSSHTQAAQFDTLTAAAADLAQNGTPLGSGSLTATNGRAQFSGSSQQWTLTGSAVAAGYAPAANGLAVTQVGAYGATADLNALTTAVTDQELQLCDLEEHQPSARFTPYVDAILLGDSTNLTLDVSNDGTLATTYAITVTGLPSGDSFFNEAINPGTTVTLPINATPAVLGAFDLEAEVTAVGSFTLTPQTTAVARLNVVDKFLQVTQVIADPDFVETGVSATTLSVEIAGAAAVKASLSRPPRPQLALIPSPFRPLPITTAAKAWTVWWKANKSVWHWHWLLIRLWRGRAARPFSP
ncbi:MAG: hypothetical protein GWP17_04005 [Aquificales bacterium]|nr:hypothetical protein [Aquificales bacterium]